MSKIEAGMVTPRTNALDHFVSQVVIWRAIQGCHLEDRASGRYFGTGVPPILEPWQSGQESWARPAAQAWLSQRTAEEEARVIAVSVLYPRPQWLLMLQRRNMLGFHTPQKVREPLLTGTLLLHLVLSACSNFCLFSQEPPLSYLI